MNDVNFRGHSPLLQTTHIPVGAGHARETLANTGVVGAGHARETPAINATHSGHHALRKGRASIANGIYLVTTTTLERQRVFEDFSAGCTAARCFEDAELLGDAKMLAWVLMPDHVHWLLQLGERDTLSKVVGRMKSACGRHVNIALSRTGAVWAKAFHDHGLRNDEDVQAVARYVVANPLRAGLVSDLGNYPFWNAVWL
ncbi:REP-associated tyrosine transposase [Ferrigenium sp. UT5]|uniref:REP-associated tyrosine transposase n=1 Tax=Ferrigenium sp. UT5 TaxID=3242105 RepID=UPI0038B3CCEE